MGEVLLLTWLCLQALAVLTPLGRDQPAQQLFAECIWVIHMVLPCLNCCMDMETLPKVLLSSGKDTSSIARLPQLSWGCLS